MTEDVKNDETTEIVEHDIEDEKSTAVEADDIDVDNDAVDDIEESEVAGETAGADSATSDGGWARTVAFLVLPIVALGLAAGAGYLKYRDNSIRNSEIAATTAMQAARDGTIALLSYQPDKVEEQLGKARDLLTGEFRNSYTSLTNDVVIPGSKERQISALASVPAAASVSATPDKAVVLLFVNQTVTVGPDAPTDTASSVRVTLEKDGDRWLISQFDPV